MPDVREVVFNSIGRIMIKLEKLKIILNNTIKDFTESI